MARNGHHGRAERRPLSGVEQTSTERCKMSGDDQSGPRQQPHAVYSITLARKRAQPPRGNNRSVRVQLKSAQLLVGPTSRAIRV